MNLFENLSETLCKIFTISSEPGSEFGLIATTLNPLFFLQKLSNAFTVMEKNNFVLELSDDKGC